MAQLNERDHSLTLFDNFDVFFGELRIEKNGLDVFLENCKPFRGCPVINIPVLNEPKKFDLTAYRERTTVEIVSTQKNLVQ